MSEEKSTTARHTSQDRRMIVLVTERSELKYVIRENMVKANIARATYRTFPPAEP